MERLEARRIMSGWMFVVLVLLAARVPVAEATEPVATTEVKRNEAKETDHPSLQFLRDNRVFVRGQLDRLRLMTTFNEEADAQMLDDRLLRLREMSVAIAAARDTVADEEAALARRQLLDSVTQLGELDQQLVLMETLASEQRLRLQELEADFLGNQETAIVTSVRGLPSDHAPGGITLSEDNTVLQVPLTAAEQNSLRQGGVAQIFHRFVEPRAHVYTVGFQGPAWDALPGVEVPVNAARDRITFVELDLSRLSPATADHGLAARVWHR